MSVTIIAEAGVNHNGSLAMALQLVDAAVVAGANIVKFQTFKSELVVSRFADKAEYQKTTTGADESQLDMIKSLELSFEDHRKIAAYCKKQNISYLSTPFDLCSLDEVISLGVQCIKIPSGEITHLQLLEKISKCNRDVILSTGMSELHEIQAALDVLSPIKLSGKTISVLHCNTEYPTPFEDVNLNVIPELFTALGIPIGYSDHTKGIEVAIAAVAMGAKIIEKHFTLDRCLPGPDHQASLEPDELAKMVKSIRHVEAALGSAKKKVTQSELKNKHIARKYLVAAKSIAVGDVFNEENITAKRIGKEGVSPMLWRSLLGQASLCEYAVDEPLKAQEIIG